MRVVRNKTPKPVRVPLDGSHFLFLGPHKTGQVADRAVDRPAFRALVERGEIEVLGHRDGPATRGGQGPNPAGRGHQQDRGSRPGGDGGRGR